MGRINVLDSDLANKIAAGEVVERPASVIKELVENSIDAGATSITVEITDGGLSYMRVADNGCGMNRDDASIAFLRHATSKIKSVDDLFSISTLGFRGEALASIGAVARVCLKTASEGDDYGTEIHVEGGKTQDILPCGCPVGTVIEVSDLFFNVPARLKFIKSARSESGHISDYISRMILARPNIAFNLINNGKTVYRSSGNGDLKDAIYSIYGAEVIPHLREINYEDSYMKLKGYIGLESVSRINRNAQSFFVNGRYIKSNKLSNSLSVAFDTRMMIGRFPMAVIAIEIDYSEVDVNVHPNKLEVRFKSEDRILSTLRHAVSSAIGTPAAPVMKFDSSTGEVISEPRDNYVRVDNPQTMSKDESRMFYDIGMNGSQSNPTEFDDPPEVAAFTMSFTKVEPEIKNGFGSESRATDSRGTEPNMGMYRHSDIIDDRIDGEPYYPAQDNGEQVQIKFDNEPFEILCSVFDSFWIVRQEESIFIVDQHAAHERLLYEGMMDGELKTSSQRLLIPIIARLTPDEYAVYEDNSELFSEFGFEIVPFGERTVRICSVPHVLNGAQNEMFFRDALALIKKNGTTAIKDVKVESIISASCKAAIKMGNIVPKQMIAGILEEFAKGEIPLTCPHGRPVMIAITKRDLYKLFKRIV